MKDYPLGPSGLPMAFHTLKRERMPLVVQFFDDVTLEERSHFVIWDAGVFKVPAYGNEPNPTRVRILSDDGMVVEYAPDRTVSEYPISPELDALRKRILSDDSPDS